MLSAWKLRRRLAAAANELDNWAWTASHEADVRHNLGRAGDIPGAHARGKAEGFRIAAEVLDEVRRG